MNWNLIKSAETYAEKCAESLKRNNHTHEHDGEEFTEADVLLIVSKLIEESCGRGVRITIAIKILDGLTEAAGRVRLLDLAHLKPSTVDAILVDFINTHAGLWCIDYALCSKDLESAVPAERQNGLTPATYRGIEFPRQRKIEKSDD